MGRPSSKACVILALLAGAATPANAQGFGTTPQGDILRGEGVAAYGIGLGNYYNAGATSINVDTYIRLNEYVSAVLKHENQENRRAHLARIAQNQKHWEQIQERINKDPEVHDINDGNALNAKKTQLLAAGSSLRCSKTTLPSETIRRIPFMLGKEGSTFSMQRLALRSSTKWPVALQDPKFTRERRAYVRALDNALDQIEGKQTLAALQDVEDALRDLYAKLDEVVKPLAEARKADLKLYTEAKNHLDRLGRMKQLLKSHQIQKTLVEIDHYSGTTLADLLEFMNRNQLQFAVPDAGDELQLYRKLFLLMDDEIKGHTDARK